MKSIVINIEPEEIRMALLENGELMEMAIERPASEHFVGNIYKARVQNVLPGMQAAFVDIGYEKNAFLYIGDGMSVNTMQSVPKQEKIHVGKNMLIQIVKDAIGSKGPRAAMHISLPGRYVVLMPTADYIGVSRRIADNGERSRLKKLAEKLCPEGMGLIMRTVAAAHTEAVIEKDIAYLLNLWRHLLLRSKVSASPTLLYRDADLVIRVVRDYFSEEVDELIIDDAPSYQLAAELIKGISPKLLERLKLADCDDVFRRYRIEEQLELLYKREVSLKSGGSIVIDKTEALTAIDVNTGRFVGESNLADTVFTTNLEAAVEIVRQLRLRDIGGIIIVDFIDMEADEQKKAVLAVLNEQLRRDRVRSNVVDITPLGLVEITRKKSRQNFDSIIYSSCPYCQGRGKVVSAHTVAVGIGRKLRRADARKHSTGGYRVEAHPLVVEAIAANGYQAKWRRELSCAIEIVKSAEMHPEVYSILQLC